MSRQIMSYHMSCVEPRRELSEAIGSKTTTVSVSEPDPMKQAFIKANYPGRSFLVAFYITDLDCVFFQKHVVIHT